MRDVLEQWRPLIDEAIADVLPRDIDESYLASFFGSPTYAYDPDAIQDGLATPVWDLLDRGGKRWRSVLFLVLVEAFGENPEEFLPYATIPEILHTGTIIVDDVEDDAELRRGAPALHTIYGQDVVLNAGNALYFIPLKVIGQNPADLQSRQQYAAYEMLTHELNRTHLGQGMDIDWHNRKSIDVTEDEYLEMCACKTGCLARIVSRLASIVTDQPESVEQAMASYAERMSVAFQIIDDVLDIEHSLGKAGDFGKAFGNDVREGKVTLMVIHAIEHGNPSQVKQLESILAEDDPSDESILDVIEILRDTGSVTYGRQKAEDLATESQHIISELDLEPQSAERLISFPEFMVNRRQ